MTKLWSSLKNSEKLECVSVKNRSSGMSLNCCAQPSWKPFSVLSGYSLVYYILICPFVYDCVIILEF